MKKRKEPVKLTIWAAAKEFQRDPKTISKAIAKAAIEPEFPDGKFSPRQIAAALFDDLEAEKIRETRHKANLLEMEEAERRKSLVKTADLLPFAERMLDAIGDVVRASKLSGDEVADVLHTLKHAKAELVDLAKPDGERI